jgi:murein DD-endopeptidase MepM/ murein hydrolase activator NlpD
MNSPLTHEQAIQYLHEAVQRLSADRQADLAAHLAACDQCRAYADQLSVLQPALTQALRAQRPARPIDSSQTVSAILQHRRRLRMHKQIIAAAGVVMIAAFALIVTSIARTPGQAWTGAPLTATTAPTSTTTHTPNTPTPISPLPTPTSISAFKSVVTTPSTSPNMDELTSFKLPWTDGITHCVTQNHRAKGNGEGLDFDLDRETILAPQDGMVTFAGWDAKGGGNTIIISHTGPFASTYAHLSSIAVKVGDQVKQGQPLGASGDTGDTPSPLLHFHLEYSGLPVDPLFAEVGHPLHPLKEGDCVTSQNTPLLTGADRFEPNDDFEQATPITANVKYDQLNFAMLNPGETDWDRDYFKIQVKSKVSITCRTLDLSQGTDTNIILYDESRNGIAGNDNATPNSGDKSSSVTYLSTYDGWLYLLVGEGFHRPSPEAQLATYSLECTTHK